MLHRRGVALIAAIALTIPISVLEATTTGAAAAAALPPAADRMPGDVPTKKTPWVLDGEVSKIVQVGNTMIAGGLFTAGRRPDERDAVHPPEPVRVRRDDGPGQPDVQPDRRRPGAAAAARPDARHRLRRRRLHQDQQQGPQPHPAAQRQHRPGGDVVQGAVDQRRHRDDGAAAQQPAVHRWLLHQDRRRQPRPARHPQRDHRRARPLHGHRRVGPPQQQRHRRPGADRPPRVRRHARRRPDGRDRQLPHRRRPGPRPDRDDRPDRRDRRRVDDLVHHAATRRSAPRARSTATCATSRCRRTARSSSSPPPAARTAARSATPPRASRPTPSAPR